MAVNTVNMPQIVCVRESFVSPEEKKQIYRTISSEGEEVKHLGLSIPLPSIQSYADTSTTGHIENLNVLRKAFQDNVT